MIDIYRHAPDGLSRKVWSFSENLRGLTLQAVYTQRRAQPKGRFLKPRPEDLWESIFEQRLTMRDRRPVDIPIDVMVEAMQQIRTPIYIGWSNDDHLYAEASIAGIKLCKK